MVRIQIEKLWVDDFYPWQSTNYPWTTINKEQEIVSISQYASTVKTGSTVLPDVYVINLQSKEPNIQEGSGTTQQVSTQTFLLSALAISTTQGCTISPITESVVLSVDNPTVAIGYTVIADTQTLSISSYIPTILLGVTISPDAETVNINVNNVDLKYDYTIFPLAQTFAISQLAIRESGNPWHDRTIPGTCSQWIERTGIDSDWEERNQVLWSPFVYPWVTTFYPWQVESRIETSVYTERTKPTTTFTERTKPTTNWN